MKDRLSFKKLLSLSMMLFALFFGAGNMIFPPAMGQAAGANVCANGTRMLMKEMSHT